MEAYCTLAGQIFFVISNFFGGGHLYYIEILFFLIKKQIIFGLGQDDLSISRQLNTAVKIRIHGKRVAAESTAALLGKDLVMKRKRLR